MRLMHLVLSRGIEQALGNLVGSTGLEGVAKRQLIRVAKQSRPQSACLSTGSPYCFWPTLPGISDMQRPAPKPRRHVVEAEPIGPRLPRSLSYRYALGVRPFLAVRVISDKIPFSPLLMGFVARAARCNDI